MPSAESPANASASTAASARSTPYREAELQRSLDGAAERLTLERERGPGGA